MTQTADNVDVGVSGIVAVAPLGTALPTSASTTLAVTFVDVGYIDETGVTETPSNDSSPINAWGGDRVRDVDSNFATEFSFIMLETSDKTLDLFYGDHDVVAGVSLPKQAWIIDYEDGDKLRRLCIPSAKIVKRDPVKIASKEAVAYGVTISCYPDASGNKYYRYRDDGVS